MTRSKSALALLFSALLVFALAGCGGAKEQPASTPKIAPPVVAKAGVLRAGVDLSYPPFAGEDKGQKVGIDIDVAAALAERLGLTLELVDVKPADIPAALEKKQIDVALGGVPIVDAVVAGVTPAGSYVADGGGLFSLATSGTPETTPTAPTSFGGLKVGCQKESAAFWKLESDYGEGYATAYDSLAEAFDALEAGEVDLVAADAIVGSYIARDHPDVRFLGQYGEASALGVLVAPDSAELEDVVRESLDALAAEGVLDAIRTKWVGNLPALEVAGSAETTTTP